MYCLQEMGYKVNKLYIHSLDDNKRYAIALPKGKLLKEFENTINQIKSFDVSKFPVIDNKLKCDNCIYRPLCH